MIGFIHKSVKKIAQRVKDGEIEIEDINENLITKSLTTEPFPHPELLIRTSGEYRISNFLLYQIAYTELYFTDTFWPAFRKQNLHEAIIDFQNRERRFGKTSQQINIPSQ